MKIESIRRVSIPIFESQTRRIADAISQRMLVRGPHLEELEEALCRLSGRRFAVLVGNGFSALLAAIRFASTQPGNVVANPISTCFAVPNAIKAAGRNIRFTDIDTNSMGLPVVDPHPSDAVIVAADHFGYLSPAALNAVPQMIPIVHDASQSFLSLTQSNRSRALMTTASFYPSKVLNGIDGGAILLDDAELAESLRRFCYYESQNAPEDDARMNLRLANIHAAFLLGTLEHLEQIRNRLVEIFGRLQQSATRQGLTVRLPHAGELPIRFIAQTSSESERDELILRFQGAGIEACREFIWLCGRELIDRFPKSDQLVRTTLSLPFHSLLTDSEIDRMESVLDQ